MVTENILDLIGNTPLLSLKKTTGCEIYAKAEFLNPGGYLFFEIGYDQGKSVPALMKQAGFTHVVCKKDLAGLDRVVYGRYMD